MPSAETVAIVSVSVSGVVTLATPLVSSWRDASREGQRAQRERSTSDFAELRGLLDDAVQLVHDQVRTLVLFEAAWIDLKQDRPSKLRAELGERRRGLGFAQARISLRLGREHDVTKAFLAAVHLTDKGIRTADLDWDDDLPREELADGIEQRTSQYWNAYERFVDAAQGLVGARRDESAG